MNKVVSFSLWGTHPAYYIGAIENAKLIGNEYYEGWKSWFYVGCDAPKEFIEQLYCVADRLIFVNCNSFSLSFERFSPIFHNDVEIFVSRDADSRVSDKEYQAVLEWEKTEFPFHAMRDHKLHHFPVMAGMWGAKKPMHDSAFENLKHLYNNKSNTFKTDQMYLSIYYENFKQLFYQHDETGNRDGEKFPKHEKFDVGSYIGERIDENNVPSSDLNSFNTESY